MLLDKLRRDKAVFVAVDFLVGENVNDPDLAVGACGDGVQLVAQQDGFTGTVAIENGQLKILNAVGNGARHRVERRDAAAARHSDNALGVAQTLVIKLALRTGERNLAAFLPVIENVLGHIAAL